MANEDSALEGRLKSYIESVQDRKLDFEIAELSEKHLINDLAMDSLDIMNFLFQIQENENVEISEAEMESHSLFKVSNLAEFVRQRLDS